MATASNPCAGSANLRHPHLFETGRNSDFSPKLIDHGCMSGAVTLTIKGMASGCTAEGSVRTTETSESGTATPKGSPDAHKGPSGKCASLEGTTPTLVRTIIWWAKSADANSALGVKGGLKNGHGTFTNPGVGQSHRQRVLGHQLCAISETRVL